MSGGRAFRRQLQRGPVLVVGATIPDDAPIEAKDALARLIVEAPGGSHAARDATLDDLSAQWLELAKSALSPTTLRG